MLRRKNNIIQQTNKPFLSKMEMLREREHLIKKGLYYKYCETPSQEKIEAIEANDKKFKAHNKKLDAFCSKKEQSEIDEWFKKGLSATA